MRLHRLEVEGFGPFRERQIVDFDAFADDGIFLIGGRTGSGKSSILDAVCFGLYGGVPRYEGGDKRLRSDHCTPEDLSEVVIEFSTAAGRFRVTRSPEYLRPAKRGGGMTKQAPTVLLEEWSGSGWEGRAARAVDVANELDEILQLSQGQFLQVILLAQNRFARFLLADSKERQALLRRLFATERFEDVQARFDERRRSSEQALGARLATVTARIDEAEDVVTAGALWGSQTDAASDDDAHAAGAGTTQERIEALRRALARAEYRAERAQAERESAEQRVTLSDASLANAREEQRAQQERDRARAALARLDDESPQIAAARDELERARTAEALRGALAAVERAEEARAAAARTRSDARAAWDDHGVELADVTAATLEHWAAELTRRTGGWAHAAELERQAPALAAERDAAQDRVTELSTRISAADAERVSLPGRLRELTAERDAARRHGDRVEELDRERGRAAARRDAAADVARLTAESVVADRALADASRELADAQTRLAQLRQRRLDGFAGELAAALAPEHACPVCGSLEHPAPAEHADAVSAEDVAAAEAARDIAAAAERRASDRCSTLGAAVAAAMALADGRTPDQADHELATAVDAHEQAQEAAKQTKILDAGVAELAARVDVLERERSAAGEEMVSAREALAVVEQRVHEAHALIREARGDHESVADRLAEALARITAARECAEASAEYDRRTAALAEARQELDSTLAASVFDDAASVRDALRSAAEREMLDARCTAHAVQREKERGILLELELRTLPEEPIDLAPVEQAAGAARAAWASSVEDAARATATAERLAGLIDAAAAEHSRSADQAAEHEVLRGLADTIAGRSGNTRKMTLEAFVLAAELEEIVTAANRRLNDMSAGRYQLRHSDALAARGAASGLGIVVDDAYTGQTRPAQSLSGGETFLSSLALALGLAEVVTARAGGIQLDTLFIDEGFGSLDADTLEVAMRTLDELRAGGRTVGVISHVEAMQEQIPAQLLVEQTDSGPSRILPAR